MSEELKKVRNLTDADIETVCQIIDGWLSTWEDNLSWEGLVDLIKIRLGKTWTRQALYRHTRIKQAFKLKKKSLSLKTSAPASRYAHLPVDLRKAMEHIEKLESENRRLEAENNQFFQQFRRWAHNAEVKGISRDALNKPLQRIDRGGSRDE